MSRRLNIQDKQSTQRVDFNRAIVPDNTSVILDAAVNLYGTEARTAVAYCGLDAWFEGNDEEFRQWASLYKQFSN